MEKNSVHNSQGLDGSTHESSEHPFDNSEGGIGFQPRPFQLTANPPSDPEGRGGTLQRTGIGTGSGVIQRVSNFSTWFILNIMRQVEEFLPSEMIPEYLVLEQRFKEIDDAEDSEWEVAEGLLFTVFNNLFPEAYLDQGKKGLLALRNAFLSGVSDIKAEPESVVAIDNQFQELYGSFEETITERNNASLEETREYLGKKQEAWGENDISSDNLQGPLLAGASYLLLNPSSSTHYLDDREEGDLPLGHGEQDKASQYHRSAKHETFSSTSAYAVKSQVAKRTAIRKTSEGNGGEAHVGLYPNSFTFYRNAELPARTKPKEESEAPETMDQGTGDLYDSSLQYKSNLSEKVVASSQGLNHLAVGVYNDYPLVMVHFDLEAFMQEYDSTGGYNAPTDGTKKAFTSFIMNYYMGLANYLAQSAGVNVSIVERSSFGFNTPSIAETAESFRINMGLMPPVYADVQAHALRMLDSHLAQLIKTKAPRDGSAHDLDTSADYFQGKEGKPARGGEIDGIADWLEFALYPIESRGKSSIANAVRNRKSLDFANAKAFDYMAQFAGKASPLGYVLKELFEHMEVGKSLSTEVSEKESHYSEAVPAVKQGYKIDEAMNEQYAVLLNRVRKNLIQIAIESKDPVLKTHMHNLSLMLTIENPKIELTLDLINELLLVHAMASIEPSSKGLPLEDGYGSESEVEDEVPEDEVQEEDYEEVRPEPEGGMMMEEHREAALPEPVGMMLEEENEEVMAGPKEMMMEGRPKTRPLTGKKIITHNGMRALLSSVESSAKVVMASELAYREKLRVDAAGSYYELSDALKAANIPAEITDDPANAHVVMRDANSCVTEGPKGATDVMESLTSSTARIWIIDTTSSTQIQMTALVEAFRGSKASVLYLASSGFKQEQFGSDRNQYGTLRAFTDNTDEGKDMLNQILALTKKSDKPLAVTAHLFRRAMKKFGAVPRNANILTGAKSTHAPSKGSFEFTDWGIFGMDLGLDPNFDPENVAKRNQLITEFKTLLAGVSEQGNDAGAERADHSHHAREFIYAEVGEKGSREKGAEASRNWFNLIQNIGGGDCLMHALNGRDLDFDEVVDFRGMIADSAGHLFGENTISGNFVYQSLHQSGLLDGEMTPLMNGRHQIPMGVYQSALRIPGLYGGEEEIQAFCHLADTPNTVYVVTSQGEIRQINEGGSNTILLLSESGKDAFTNTVKKLLTASNLVLFKSRNHWEQITGVPQENVAEA